MTTDDMNTAITLANDVFAPTGVQFQFYSAESYPLSIDTRDAMVTWDDLRPLWEGLNITCMSCVDQPAQKLVDWLFQLTSFFPFQYVSWLGCGGDSEGDGELSTSFLSSPLVSPHEWGHAFGLPHTFEVLNSCADSNHPNGVPVLWPLSCNYWDLVYAARGEGIPNTYFGSQQSCLEHTTLWMALGTGFTLFKIDSRDCDQGPDVESNKGPRRVNNGIMTIQDPRCVGCTADWNVPNDGVEQYSTGDAPIAGYAKYIGSQGALNVMTYCAASGCPPPAVGRGFFSPSQVAVVQQHLAANPWLQSDPQCSSGIARGNVCCAASCGTCGGTGCSSRPGGTGACCTGAVWQSAPSCTYSGPPCVLTDPQCVTGIQSGGVCCPPGCGTCGGTGCSGRPGGPANCCSGAILNSGVSCADSMPPCVMP
jgi:hypothetical protein